MHTTHTTILSSTKSQAVDEFRHWVHEEPVILLVVLGEGSEVEALVERSDKMAAQLSLEFPGLPHVIWAMRREHLQDELSGLEGTASLKAKLPTCQAFALNLTDKLVDVIGANEIADLVRIFEAMNKALQKVAA
jgi:hypothetical protein